MRRTLFILLACVTMCDARNLSVHHVPASDAEKLLAEGDVLLIDLRPDKEYSGGHIPGARSIPFKDFSKMLGTLPKDKTQPVLIYDATGANSITAAHTLYRQGYKDVYELSGGLRAWTAAQQPLQVSPPTKP